MKRLLTLVLGMTLLCSAAEAKDHAGIAGDTLDAAHFTLIDNGMPVPVLVDAEDQPGVMIAARSLLKDFGRVSGTDARLLEEPSASRIVVAGTLESRFIAKLVKQKKLDRKQLQGKCEKYIMTVVDKPFDGVDEALVIAGSDRRGAIYGIYELSEQLGVSPWYFWADVPAEQHKNLSIRRGTYTAGEPAVRYRGLFLNDEAPCLTSWVKNHYGTERGGRAFYADLFELVLRLRGNFVWPAMWSWAFYADDPENSHVANEMGVVMGTSHHEPMARNHEEWTRDKAQYGNIWDYNRNKEGLQKFFREGMERAAGTEDLITIGMRGDGDEGLAGSVEDNIRMMEGLFEDQRQIIREVTGRPAAERPQVWALYKEVQSYYEQGLRVPDDVTILLSDDNWGDVRRLPDAVERQRKGGWGLYYHVDYVGAPRNSKWLNITPIQNMWEQLTLTYQYGVDRLWVLNVGDLKPMEYPIDLFMDMAWKPDQYNAASLLDHTRMFCAQQLGENVAAEAARLLNLYSKYNGRVTPEMLDSRTYDLESGEWRRVTDDYIRLEAEALRLFPSVDEAHRDAYRQLILFPIQAMANLYDMYYSQAMNNALAAKGMPEANEWADRCEAAFKRDAALNAAYNTDIAGGKWNGMMTQKHIGYTSWNDNFPADRLPRLNRVEATDARGGYVYTEKNGMVVMEAPHFFEAKDAASAAWTEIPYMGRTLGAVSLQPYNVATDGAELTYRFKLDKACDAPKMVICLKSTLAFMRPEGHRFTWSLDGGEPAEVVFNDRLNEDSRNIYSVYYPTVAGRVVEMTITLPALSEGQHDLKITPIEPGTVFETFVIDAGGYRKTYLHGEESPVSRL